MFYENNIDFSEVGEVIHSIKDKCTNSQCISELIDFLQEQVEVLEDECVERENDLDVYDSYDN